MICGDVLCIYNLENYIVGVRDNGRRSIKVCSMLSTDPLSDPENTASRISEPGAGPGDSWGDDTDEDVDTKKVSKKEGL